MEEEFLTRLINVDDDFEDASWDDEEAEESEVDDDEAEEEDGDSSSEDGAE